MDWLLAYVGVLGTLAVLYLAIWTRCPFCRARIHRGIARCPACSGRFD